MRRNLHFTLSALFACVALSACQQPKSYTPELPPQEVRDEELNQLVMSEKLKAKGGQPKAWRNIKNMRKRFEDVGSLIEKAGAEICVELNLQDKGCYYYFHLSRDEEVNAKADGKSVIIFTGMMRFIESDDELAVVMAHEFAHNLMGHVQAQKNNASMGMLLGVAVDSIADSQGLNTSGEITRLGSEAGSVRYGIEFEKEADYIGLYVMAKAGYDINKAPLLWRRMSLDNPDDIYGSLTHPSNAERFVALKKAIYEIEYKRKHKLPVLPDFKMGS